ncbi:hypothetical protein HDU87_006815 [Geranomyces variabilis]|uniref:NDT80 domain-containing protein n=1 Tax=Geranomyces variabilis TaxID=109894 RepID=A0AAD5TQE6_9FUNG|nr:hypothetical protein HDU87_006815 [Geranomyces variabilis]
MSQLPHSPEAAADSPLPPPPEVPPADHQQQHSTDSLHIHANDPNPLSENAITAAAAAAAAVAAAAAAASAPAGISTAPDTHHGDHRGEQKDHQEHIDPLPEAPVSTTALPSTATGPSHHLAPQQQPQHPRLAHHPPGTHDEGSSSSAAQLPPHHPHSPQHQQRGILVDQQAAQVLHEKALAQQLHAQNTFGVPYTGATRTQSPGAAYRGNAGITSAASPAQEASHQQQQQPQDLQQQQQQQPALPLPQQSQQLPSLQQAQNSPQFQNNSQDQQGQQGQQDQESQAGANRDPPSPTQYGASTNPTTNANALPGQPESWQEAAPYWRPTTQSCAMYNMDRTKTYELKLNPRVERGFFVADGDWTCYRRNYFQVSLGFSATDQVGQRAELPSLIAADGRLQTATAFYVGVAARTSNGQRVVELVQHTTKRDKGPQLVPEPRMCQPQDSPSALDTFHTVTFDRLQFKAATANNGKRRAAQQYHVLIAELFAEFPDHTRCRVAFAESAPLVVRGRAPGHYANMTARPPRTNSTAPPPNYYGNNGNGQTPQPLSSEQHAGEQHAQVLPPLPQHLHPLHPLAGPHEHSSTITLPQPNVHHHQQHQPHQQHQQQHQPQAVQVKTSVHPPSSHLASFHPHHPSVMYSQPASPAALGPEAQQYFHHQQQLHGQQQHHFQQYSYLPAHLLAQQQQQQQQLRAPPPAGNGGTMSGTSTPHSHVSGHQHLQQQPQTVYHDHATYEHPHHPQHAASSSSPAHLAHQQHPVQHQQQQQQHHHQQYQSHQQQPSHFAPSAQQHQPHIPQHQPLHQHQGHHQGSSSLPQSRGGGGGGGGVAGVVSGGELDIQHSQALHMKLHALHQEQQQHQQHMPQESPPPPALPLPNDRHHHHHPQHVDVDDNNRLPPLSNLMPQPVVQEPHAAQDEQPQHQHRHAHVGGGHHHGHHHAHHHHHSAHHQQQQQQQQHTHEPPPLQEHHHEVVQHHHQHHHEQPQQQQAMQEGGGVHVEAAAAAAAMQSRVRSATPVPMMAPAPVSLVAAGGGQVSGGKENAAAAGGGGGNEGAVDANEQQGACEAAEDARVRS